MTNDPKIPSVSRGNCGRQESSLIWFLNVLTEVTMKIFLVAYSNKLSPTPNASHLLVDCQEKEQTQTINICE